MSTELLDSVRRACTRLEEREPEVRALLPEPGRLARLERDAEMLAARFPGEDERPPLFGMLLGVKDIVRQCKERFPD